jgi:diadenosine tetraphosphate (Ap4A) HIT family hydrolase
MQATDFFPATTKASRILCSLPDRDLSMPDTTPCPFCTPDPKVIKAENELWYARWDRFPASKGHMLVIPFRHVRDCFDTTAEEKRSLFELIDAAKKIIDEKYSPDGYNVGFNSGRVAGQGVMHCHVHVIPRYHGDIDNPHGGVRGVVRKWER